MFFTACFFTANSPGIQGGVGAEIRSFYLITACGKHCGTGWSSLRRFMWLSPSPTRLLLPAWRQIEPDNLTWLLLQNHHCQRHSVEMLFILGVWFCGKCVSNVSFLCFISTSVPFLTVLISDICRARAAFKYVNQVTITPSFPTETHLLNPHSRHYLVFAQSIQLNLFSLKQ